MASEKEKKERIRKFWNICLRGESLKSEKFHKIIFLLVCGFSFWSRDFWSSGNNGSLQEVESIFFLLDFLSFFPLFSSFFNWNIVLGLLFALPALLMRLFNNLLMWESMWKQDNAPNPYFGPSILLQFVYWWLMKYLRKWRWIKQFFILSAIQMIKSQLNKTMRDQRSPSCVNGRSLIGSSRNKGQQGIDFKITKEGATRLF